MKKIFRILGILILITAASNTTLSCKWGCTNGDYDLNDANQKDISCNYLVPDLEKRTEKIISDRLDNNGNDNSSLKSYLDNFLNPWLNKTNKKNQFVKNLETKIQFKASQKAINKFNLLATNTRNFTNFNDLQKQLNTTNLGKTYVNINWNNLFNLLNLDNTTINNIKTQLSCFYNIFAQVYGKENVLKMLYRIGFKKFNNNIVAQLRAGFFCASSHCSLIQVMGCGTSTFSEQSITDSYHSGWWATQSIIAIIVHEYGHVLGNFLHLNLQGRQNINSLADNDANKWWNNYFNTSSFVLKNNLSKEKIDDETNYMISSLALGTRINVPIYQKLLAYGIVRSNYGRISHLDLFAEAFDQWIETPEDQRNIAWEKLDKFFRIDLPKVL